eukprot:2947605-Amphidinium_carterae.2
MDDNIYDNDDECEFDNNTVTTIRQNLITLHMHKTTNNTITKMQRMNIKLPTPAQLDGRTP